MDNIHFLREQVPVQAAVSDRLGQMRVGPVRRFLQIRDGPGRHPPVAPEPPQ